MFTKIDTTVLDKKNIDFSVLLDFLGKVLY